MPNLRNVIPSTGQLTAFEAASRFGSFTRAASELCVSQAAVSRMVRELEARLGVRLFTRNRHDVSLTDAGRQYALVVRSTLQRLADATQDMQEQSSEETSLIVYSDLSIDTSYVFPRLREFLAPYPDVQLNLISSGIPIEQSSARFHVGFQLGHVQTRDFETVALSGDTIFAVCSPGFLAQNPDSVTPEGMARAPLLHFEQPGRNWLDWAGFFEKIGVNYALPQKRITFSSYPSLLYAAEKGDGIALGWKLSVSSRLGAGTLVQIGKDALPVSDNLHAYFPNEQVRNPLADSFVQWLQVRE